MADCKKKPCCETTVSQKSINENITFTLNENNQIVLTIGNKIYSVQLNDSGGGIVTGGGDYVNVPIVSDNQTSFVNALPENTVLKAVFLNGQLIKSSDYFVTSLRNLNWNADYQLNISTGTPDELVVVVSGIIEET